MAADEIKFSHNSFSPDVYADRCSGTHVLFGNMRITFEVARVNHETTPGPVERVVVGRLVMPIHEAEGMARLILSQIEGMKADMESQTRPLN